MIQTMSMSSSMASLFSPPPSTHSLHTLSRPNTFLAHKPYHNQHFLSSKFKKPRDILFCAVSGNEEAPVGTTIVAEQVPVGTTTVAEEAEVGTTNAAVGTTIVAEEVPVGTTTVAEDLPLDTTNAAVGTTTVAEEAEVGTTNAAVGTTNAAVGTTDAAEEVPAVVEKRESLSSNGSVPAPVESAVLGVKFEDPKWVNGTWNLSMFQKDGKTDWDAVIDAEARRRKWLETNPESSSNDEPVMFDTSTIPWWAWMKRFHLPEAELLNGRAAMVGFFMAYFVDSLTGVGLVDQMGNFFCKTLLFIAVAGVLLIRKNEDLENLKKLLEETTFYDKQWQATWQDETSNNTKNKQ